MKTKKPLLTACFLFILLTLVVLLTGCDLFEQTYYWYDADGTLLWQETVELGEASPYYPLPLDDEKWDYTKWVYGDSENERIAYRTPKESYFCGNVFQIIIQDLGEQPIATGSAFVFNRDGWFITNAHVMENAYFAQAIFNIPNSESGESFTYLTINSGTYYHLDKDIYIGKIDDYSKIESYYKEFTFNSNYKIGEKTYSIGYPNSSTDLKINEGKVTNTWSNIYDKLYSGNSYVCSSSYISHGSSGGILVNRNFEIIGITTLGWMDDNDNFISGAAISTFNFSNLLQNTNEQELITLQERFHNDEKAFIGLFNDMKSDEADGTTKKVFLDDDTLAYQYEVSEEGINDDEIKYIRKTSFLVSTDGYISYETEFYWSDGGRRNIKFYGYYDHQKGFANFQYDFKYTWSSGTYYTIKCTNINYSPTLSLTLNQCYVYDHSYGYTPSDENITYVKEQFNYVYENMVDMMKNYSSDHYPHEYGEWSIIQEATCVLDGIKERVCSCGEKETETIPALGHTFGDWIETEEPTCTENGFLERVCSCGEKETETISALGHTFGDWIKIKNPTCTEKGVEKRECNICGLYEEKDIEAIGHIESNYVIDIEPTIYTEGKQHTYCTVCLEIICSDITIPKIVSNGFTVERNYTFKTCTITDIGSCQDTDVGIPPVIDGYKVTAIACDAFAYCKFIENVVIPDGITSIGESSFYLCENLTSIVIPDSVTSIGNSAFYSCKNLSSIVIPNSVISIGNYAFGLCENLTSIDVPDSVTSFGHSVFYSCSSLTSVVISNQITEIKHSTFYDCSSLTSVLIPDGLTIIDSKAFYNCVALTFISIPNSVTGIGHETFRGCVSLESVTIPDSIVAIGVRAFCDCDSITTIVIPKSIKSIDVAAFQSCDNLTTVEINDDYWYETSIGMSAFSSCKSLTSVSIGPSVSIGDNAFANCTILSSIFYDSTISSWNNKNKGVSWNKNTGSYTIYCTDGSITKDGAVTYN